jgi:hypothetical protein
MSAALLAALLAATPAPPAVTAPAAGDRWAAGSSHGITWDAGPAASGTATLDFSPDAGRTWQRIADAVPNDGRYLARVPDRISDTCLVRVTAGGVTALSALFAVAPSQEVTDYEWVSINPTAPFAARDGAGALTYHGRMWFLGGWNPGDKKHFPRICNNEVWSSADGKDWRLDKPNTFLDAKFDPTKDWEGRHTAGYVVHRDRMWIVGGDVNQGHYHFDVWNSSDGKSWTYVNAGKPVPWGPRALHYTVAFRDKIWVIGGQTIPGIAPGPELFHHDVWNSEDGVSWTKVEPKQLFTPQRGLIGGSAVFKDRIWILGGGTYDTPNKPQRLFYNDVWSSADGATWERHLDKAPWGGREYHDVAVFDGRLWVMEGYTEKVGNRNDVWYSADGVNWYEVAKTPWAPRHAASVYVHDGGLWMVAGNNMRPDVWKLRHKPAAAK